MFRVLECRWICDSNRLALGKRDQLVERVGVKSAQGLVRYVAKMWAYGDVVHRAEWMVRGRRLDIEDIDARAGDAARLQRRD